MVKLGRQQRALLRLQGKLARRRFQRERGRWIGLLLALVVILPLVLVAALLTWLAYRYLCYSVAFGRLAPLAGDGRCIGIYWGYEVMAVVLITLWLLWIAIPIVAAPLSEGIDLEQLLVYPLRRRDLLIGVLLGTLFDYPTYFALPLFAAIVIGFGGLPLSYPASSVQLLPLLLLVCLLAYLLMAVSSQLMLTLFGGLLQSRRMRDVAVLLFSIFGFACWFGTQFVSRLARLGEQLQFDEQLFASEPLRRLQWLPPGALARAVEQAAGGAWLVALLWIGYALLWLLLLGWLWAVLLGRLLTGQGFFLDVAPQQARRRRTRRRRAPLFAGLLTAATRAIAIKELRAAWRIPQRRIGTLQAFLMPVLVLLFPLLDGGLARFGLSDNLLFLVPSYTLFLFWFLGQNMLGWEHRGLAMLLATPVARRRIFAGKTVAQLVLGVPPLALAGLVLTLFSGSAAVLLASLCGLLMSLPAIAVNVLASARFAYPVQLDFNRRRARPTRGGCLTTVSYLFLIPFALLLINLPLLMPLLLLRFDRIGLPTAALLVLAGGIYGVAILHASIGWAGRILLAREPEMLAAAQPTED